MNILYPIDAKQEKSWVEQSEERELIHYLKETIDNICDRVRNKMVAPYYALQGINGKNPPKEIVDIGIKEIHWLCHVYFPEIIAEVSRKIKNEC